MKVMGKILGSLTVMIIPISVLIVLSTNKTPDEEIEQARTAISEARVVRAELYSEDLFREASEKYNRAMKLWKEENRKLIFMRNYSDIKKLADESYMDALGAREDAIVASARERKALKTRLEITKSQISYFQEIFEKLPVTRSLREQNSKGRFYFAEAELAYMDGRFVVCADRLKESSSYLMESYNTARVMLDEYFSKWPTWARWINETIAGTKGSSYEAIVVDKFDRKCYIYSKGEMIEQFDIDLGSNWMGHKSQRGDMATPEGIYRVTKLKQHSETKYYKALLINYPNKQDSERFLIAKMKGLISNGSEIGGMIEIHGNGGTGIDWTDGCIALSNNDMDILFSLSRTGTIVTIVGSVRPIDEILKYNK